MEPVNEDTSTGLDFVEALATCIHDIKNSAGVVAIHNSLWEYFKRRITDAPWPIATVRLDCNATVFAHLALHSFGPRAMQDITAATPVEVFSHTDASKSSVLIAVAAGTTISRSEQRREIVAAMGLLQASMKAGGI